MISKLQGEDALHKETVARATEEAGHPETALWRGLASLTTSFRPECSWPFKVSIAAWASASEAISTKPKPLLRPVASSVMMFTVRTVPCWEGNCSRSVLLSS